MVEVPSVQGPLDPDNANRSRPGGAGLRVQLLTVLGGLTLASFLPLYVAVAQLTRHTLDVERDESARRLGRSITSGLVSALEDGVEAQTLRARSLGGASSSWTGPTLADGSLAIRVLSPTPLPHRVLAWGNEQALAATSGARAPASADVATGEAIAHVEDPALGSLMVISRPVPRTHQVVEAVLALGDRSARARPLLRLVAFYTGTFAIVLLVVAYLWLTRLIVRPIRALVAATRGLEHGRRQLELRVVSGGARELVELGRALAQATGRLVAREQTLAAKVEQLELARHQLLSARDAVVRAERLASVGRLAAGLAHEVGNPIAAILGLQDVLLGAEPEALDEESRDLIVRMKRETERVHRVMRDLLDFARAGQLGMVETASADVPEVVGEVLALLTPQRAMHRVELSTALQPGLPPARIEATRLLQVLLNLVLNAADALAAKPPPGDPEPRSGARGHITIRARRVPRGLELATPEPHGDQVTIEVIDDGAGVPADIRERLFEPFVTSKQVGKGTGLGLAISRSLIEAAQGTLTLEDPAEPPHGTCFRITLPAALAASTTSASADHAANVVAAVSTDGAADPSSLEVPWRATP